MEVNNKFNNIEYFHQAMCNVNGKILFCSDYNNKKCLKVCDYYIARQNNTEELKLQENKLEKIVIKK